MYCILVKYFPKQDVMLRGVEYQMEHAPLGAMLPSSHTETFSAK